MSNINSKKPRIEEKYWIKFKNSSVILFLQKDLECPELGENKDSFISSILEFLSNSNKILNSTSRSGESHTSFGNFLKTF